MYVILAIVMLLRGFADAIMMITQKALSVGASEGYLPRTITTRSSPRMARS